MTDTEIYMAIHAEEDERVLADVMRRLLADGNVELTSWSGVAFSLATFTGTTRVTGKDLEALRRAVS